MRALGGLAALSLVAACTGEARRIGDVIVRLSACERTAPWEEPPETGAFVQVIVLTRSDADSDPEWRRFFSGWLFKKAPASTSSSTRSTMSGSRTAG